MGRLPALLVGLRQLGIDAVAAQKNYPRKFLPVFLAVAGLAEQAEVAVGGLAKILGWRRGGTL